MSFALATLAAASTVMAGSHCGVQRKALLALPERAFDQELGGGWRAVAARSECRRAAADLIAAYRRSHPAARSILRWHEGQLRASVGQTRKAISLFEASRHPEDTDDWGWNDYVDATVAFLRRDRKALAAARARLAARPKPQTWNPLDPEGRPLPIAWPVNLNVVDGLIRCFGKPYDQAYAGCATPIRIQRP